MSDREQCRAAYIEMYRAMIAKDIPALSTVLDDSFALVHMTGMRQTKWCLSCPIPKITIPAWTLPRKSSGRMPGATVLKGLAVRGSKAQNDAEGTGADVANWLKSIGLTQ